MKQSLFSGFVTILVTASLCAMPLAAGGHEAAEKEKTAEARGDKGGKPWVLDIEEATVENDHDRVVRWTGRYLQLVLMSLKPGEIIDLELHEGHDQFIRIEEGEARIKMGKTRDALTFDKQVSADWSILIPAGYWHQVINTGETELKLYTLYGPPEHPAGTVHKTYGEAEEHVH